MGRTYTPTYRVEYRDQQGWHAQCWERHYGRPTKTNLEAWRVFFNGSFQPDGVNAHVSREVGYVPHVSRARIVHQETGEVKAETIAHAFEVV